MLKINKITDNPRQSQTIILPDGSNVFLKLEFKPLQTGWFITELTHESFSIKGQRIVTSPNILHQFYKLIPFGVACFVDGNREPTFIQDFKSGAAVLYILTDEEVLSFEEYLSDGSF